MNILFLNVIIFSSFICVIIGGVSEGIVSFIGKFFLIECVIFSYIGIIIDFGIFKVVVVIFEKKGIMVKISL